MIKIFLIQGFGVFRQTTVLGMSVGEVMATFLTHARVGSVQQVVVVIWDQRAAGVVIVEGPVGVVHGARPDLSPHHFLAVALHYDLWI